MKLPFVKIIEFLETKMSMSHIYQPLLIKTLIETGGSATLRQLSLAFLCQDESQIIYYEDRIKQMPLKVLGKHGIVSKGGDLVTLNIEMRRQVYEAAKATHPERWSNKTRNWDYIGEVWLNPPADANTSSTSAKAA
ncbi:MAG: hypothetical protein R6V84_00730 [Desulfobacterales bacterium]